MKNIKIKVWKDGKVATRGIEPKDIGDGWALHRSATDNGWSVTAIISGKCLAQGVSLRDARVLYYAARKWWPNPIANPLAVGVEPAPEWRFWIDRISGGYTGEKPPSSPMLAKIKAKRKGKK